jgi:hypothetical protein
MLAAARYHGPITLHVEYENPDPVAALSHDFQTLKKWVDEAYSVA